MKYIRTENKGFIIFASFIDHSTMVERNVGLLDEVISAGFVGVCSDGLYCHGKSTTLKIGPLPDDTERLKSQLMS
jgi:hypothetical protein